MASFYSPELMLHYLKKRKPIDILNIITTYFWTSGCASLNSSVKLFPYMTPPLMCIQLSALFPTQVGVYFCRRLDSKRKTHTKNLILHIPHLITLVLIFHTRQMQNVNLSRHFLFLWKWLTLILSAETSWRQQWRQSCEGSEQRWDVCICGTVDVTCRVTS